MLGKEHISTALLNDKKVGDDNYILFKYVLFELNFFFLNQLNNFIVYHT